MSVTLRRSDRHAGSCRNLLERVAECVLEDDHLRLFGRDTCERVAELPPQLGDANAASRVVLEVGAELLGKRLVRPRPLAFRDITARIDDEPVQPGRELRLAAELS